MNLASNTQSIQAEFGANIIATGSFLAGRDAAAQQLRQRQRLHYLLQKRPHRWLQRSTSFPRSNADLKVPFRYVDGSGTPIPITGWALSLMVRQEPQDDRAFISLVSPSTGISITNGANGEFVVVLPKTGLLGMQPGTYVHDLVALRPDGGIETMWEGTLTHTMGVTR